MCFQGKACGVQDTWGYTSVFKQLGFVSGSALIQSSIHSFIQQANDVWQNFFFPPFLDSQAAQQNESLSFGTQILQSGRAGGASVWGTVGSRMWAREFEEAVCRQPLSNHWTSCSPGQGSGDVQGSEEWVSFPCRPVSSGLLPWPVSPCLRPAALRGWREQRRRLC